MFTEAAPTPLSDTRFPGLHWEPANPFAKKADHDAKNRIVADDKAFDITVVPDISFLREATINLLPVRPFADYSQHVGFIDLEWVGCDGGPALGDGSDVIVAIGIKARGKHYIGCNPAKSEADLLRWFFQQLAKLELKVISGFSCYGFYRGGAEVLVDFGMVYHRAELHGVTGCPWQRREGVFNRYRWNNALVFGSPLETPAWDSGRYELIDLYPQAESYDALTRKLESCSLKNAAIGWGLRDDRRIEIGKDVYKYWANGDIDIIIEYLKFDLDDTELLWNFLIPQKYFMKSYMDWDLQRITTTGTGSWWNQFLQKQTGQKPDKTQTCSYKGALTYYHSGIYRNCAKFDFSGLYPSIMLTWLIASIKDTDYTSLKTLLFLLQYRKDIKSSQAFKEGCKDADGQQHTAKILANSLYGLWNTTGLAFNDPYAGAAITAYGRNLARYMISWLDDHGVQTHAVDTDGAVVSFKVDNFTNDAERKTKYKALCAELNATLPGTTAVEYEDDIPFIFIPPNINSTKKASKILAEKLNSIDCYDDVKPDQLSPGLSKNYVYFAEKKDGKFKLVSKGKYRKRDKTWLASGFVLELMTKLFYDGVEVAQDYAQSIRDQITDGSMPLAKLQKTVLVAANWKMYPANGFPVGTKPTVHFVWRGETSGVRVIKKVFVPSDDIAEPWSKDYYLDEFDKILSETGITLIPAMSQLLLV